MYGNKEFFKEEQISWAALELTTDKPPIYSQIFVIFFALFLGSVILYSAYTEVPVTVEGLGKITSEAAALPIKTSATFTVDQVNVVENQDVQKGQVLVTSAENLKKEEMVKLKTFLAGVKRINSRPAQNLCLDCARELNSTLQVYLSIKAQGEIVSLLSPISDQLRQLKTQIESHGQIGGSLASVKLQVQNAKSKLAEIRKHKAERVLAKEMEELKAVVVSGETQMNERYRTSSLQIRDLRGTLRARTGELENRLDQFGRVYTVVAPFDGRVSNLKIKGAGELLSGGQVLMEIIPKNTRLMALIDIQNRDIANVRVGDQVIIYIDALPEMDFGHASGVVKEIVRSEQVDQGGPQQGGATAANFKLKVQLKEQFLAKKNGEQKQFIFGMTLRGRIVSRYESLLKSFYRVLFKIKDDVQVSK